MSYIVFFNSNDNTLVICKSAAGLYLINTKKYVASLNELLITF